MAIAPTVIDFLQRHGVSYAVLAHPHTERTRDTATQAHVAPGRLAKAVVLADEAGFVMVVIPGNRHVSLNTVSGKLGRRLELVPEDRIAPVFRDCEAGAIPPLGAAYGMNTVLDDHLVGLPEVFFEAGDHLEVIRVRGDEFVRLLADARHGQFSH